MSMKASTRRSVLTSSARNSSPVNEGFELASSLIWRLPADELRDTRAVVLSEHLHSALALLLKEHFTHLFEAWVPEEVTETLRVRCVEQPEGLEPEGRQREDRVQGQPGRGQCAPQQREVVRVRERELEIRPLFEDRRRDDRFGRIAEGGGDAWRCLRDGRGLRSRFRGGRGGRLSASRARHRRLRLLARGHSVTFYEVCRPIPHSEFRIPNSLRIPHSALRIPFMPTESTADRAGAFRPSGIRCWTGVRCRAVRRRARLPDEGCARAVRTARRPNPPGRPLPRCRASQTGWCCPQSRETSSSMPCMPHRVCGSSAPKGSSMSTTRGPLMSVRAMATRCFIPPESCLG